MSRRSSCNRLPARGSRFTPQAKVPHYIKTSMVPARAGLDPIATTRQMASDMLDAAYREGGLTQDGLLLLGYTMHQIQFCAATARELANKQAVMT